MAQSHEQAFERFFDRHGSLVLGVLTRLLGSRDEAEEVLQDVFLEVWDRASRYRADRASGKTWLLMLARSRALDRLRSRSARSRREERFSDERTDKVASPLGTARLEAEESNRDLAGALAELPEDQRQCVVLSFYRGLSQSQIAEELRVPLGTVKYRYLSGMRKLRDSFREQSEHQPTGR